MLRSRAIDTRLNHQRHGDKRDRKAPAPVPPVDLAGAPVACGRCRITSTGREEVTRAQGYAATAGRGRPCQICMECMEELRQ